VRRADRSPASDRGAACRDGHRLRTERRVTATAAFTDAGGSAFTPLDAEAGAPREGRERVIPSDPEETERSPSEARVDPATR
jgi:hypothetical protein